MNSPPVVRSQSAPLPIITSSQHVNSSLNAEGPNSTNPVDQCNPKSPPPPPTDDYDDFEASSSLSITTNSINNMNETLKKPVKPSLLTSCFPPTNVHDETIRKYKRNILSQILNGEATATRMRGVASSNSQCQASQNEDFDKKCIVCLEPVVDPLSFPCGIPFHRACRLCVNRYVTFTFSQRATVFTCPGGCGAVLSDALLRETLSMQDFSVLQIRRARGVDEGGEAHRVRLLVHESAASRCPLGHAYCPGQQLGSLVASTSFPLTHHFSRETLLCACAPGVHRCLLCKEVVPDPVLPTTRIGHWRRRMFYSPHFCQDPDLAAMLKDVVRNPSASCKPCPHCFILIHRYDGCNNMVCQSCNGRYCWACLAVHNGTCEAEKMAALVRLPRVRFQEVFEPVANAGFFAAKALATPFLLVALPFVVGARRIRTCLENASDRRSGFVKSTSKRTHLVTSGVHIYSSCSPTQFPGAFVDGLHQAGLDIDGEGSWARNPEGVQTCFTWFRGPSWEGANDRKGEFLVVVHGHELGEGECPCVEHGRDTTRAEAEIRAFGFSPEFPVCIVMPWSEVEEFVRPGDVVDLISRQVLQVTRSVTIPPPLELVAPSLSEGGIVV